MQLKAVVFLGMFCASSALGQSVLTTPSRLLNGDLTIAPSLGDQRSPSIARGAGAQLCAWSDSRALQYGGDDQGESYSDIWIQLLGPQNEPLWTTPRRVSAELERDVAPRVTWNGSSWLVTWMTQPLSASNFYSRVLAVRVDASGAVLDPAPLELFSGLVLAHEVASDGVGWVVVSMSGSGGGIARTVSSNLVNPLGPVVPSMRFGSVAFAQGAYLFTSVAPGTSGTSDIFGQRFTSTLVPIDAAPFPIVSSAMNDGGQLIASNGNEFLMAWSESDQTQIAAVRCGRVSSSGALLSNQALTASTFGGPFPSAVDWDGAQWLVGLPNALARVSAAGQVLDFGGFNVRPPDGLSRSQLALAGAVGGGAHAVWMQNVPAPLLTGNQRYAVRSSRVTSPASLGVEHVPAPGAPSQSMPALAASGTSIGVLLRSENGQSARLVFARVDPNGAPLDAQPVLLSSAADIRSPSLAWDGARYLAVWIESQPFPVGATIRARRIAADGALLDPAPIILGVPSPGTFSEVDVAGRAGEFAVVGLRWNSVSAWRVRGSDGSVLNGPINIASHDARRVSICATAGGFAAAWVHFALQGQGSEASGCLLDPQITPGPLFVIAGAIPTQYFRSVSVATSGSELLCAWDVGLTLAENSDRRIFARRFDLNGAALGTAPFQVAPTPGRAQLFPDLAWDGAQYVCAYQELVDALQSDVRIARVSSQGVVLDSQGLSIDATATSEGQPSTVGLGGGRTLVASSVLRAEAPFASYRVALRAAIDGCPPPTAYCVAKLNSQQCLPAIASSGVPSATGAGSCTVTAANILNGTNGLLLYGYQSAAVPFQGGLLCVAPPRRRTPIQNSGATGSSNPCAGQFTFDLNAYILSGSDPALQAPGQTIACQFWSRDPGDPFGTGLTDALSGVVCW